VDEGKAPAVSAMGKSWRLTTAAWVSLGLVCAVFAAVGVLAETWSGPSNKIGGAVLLLVSPAAVYRALRVRLTIDGDTLRVQNMIHRHEIGLADVVRIEPSRFGVDIIYMRQGHRRRISATAAEGILDPVIFRRRVPRTLLVADEIAGHLPRTLHHG
jgi:hypothetical protein